MVIIPKSAIDRRGKKKEEEKVVKSKGDLSERDRLELARARGKRAGLPEEKMPIMERGKLTTSKEQEQIKEKEKGKDLFSKVKTPEQIFGKDFEGGVLPPRDLSKIDTSEWFTDKDTGEQFQLDEKGERKYLHSGEVSPVTAEDIASVATLGVGSVGVSGAKIAVKGVLKLGAKETIEEIGKKTIAKITDKTIRKMSLDKLRILFPKATENQLIKAAANAERQTINEMSKTLLKSSSLFNKKALLKLGIGAYSFSSFVGMWYSADNLPTISSLGSRDAKTDFLWNGISAPETLKKMNFYLGNAQAGKIGTIGIMIANPLLAPIGAFFLRGTNANIQKIRDDIAFIESQGGNQE